MVSLQSIIWVFFLYNSSRVINVLLTKLARDRPGRISALGLFCTDLAALSPYCQDLGPGRYSPSTALVLGCEKYWKDNKDNSRHLGRKHARIFVLGHYLFLVSHSFPRASLSENCSLLGTDNVCG